MLKRFLSYFVPITVHKKTSEISTSLEVTWNDGQLVLDSKNTNYSYGSLQRILRKGLLYIGYERIRNFDSILILGVAGGSVIKTLVEEIHFKGAVTGVEIDPEIIAIANTYFDLNSYKNVTVTIEDAFEFILKTEEQYELIIIDIFQDTVMPSFLFQDYFVSHIKNVLRVNGFILFNTMTLSKEDAERNKEYRTLFSSDYSVRMYPKIENHNELFTIKKLR